ncbi:MAG TPA: hypothetical protein VMM13_12750 [Euzebya sp.]|nr:hypothetical protein [Euzebya sp.]
MIIQGQRRLGSDRPASTVATAAATAACPEGIEEPWGSGINRARPSFW